MEPSSVLISLATVVNLHPETYKSLFHYSISNDKILLPETTVLRTEKA